MPSSVDVILDVIHHEHLLRSRLKLIMRGPLQAYFTYMHQPRVPQTLVGRIALAKARYAEHRGWRNVLNIHNEKPFDEFGQGMGISMEILVAVADHVEVQYFQSYHLFVLILERGYTGSDNEEEDTKAPEETHCAEWV